jgi:hypothetical protein
MESKKRQEASSLGLHFISSVDHSIRWTARLSISDHAKKHAPFPQFSFARSFYGVRRMTLALQAQDWPVNHKRTRRLMRTMGLEARKVYAGLIEGTQHRPSAVPRSSASTFLKFRAHNAEINVENIIQSCHKAQKDRIYHSRRKDDDICLPQIRTKRFMTLPARFAIVNRLIDVGREPALEVGKLASRDRAAIPFSQRSTRSAVLRHRAATARQESDSIRVQRAARGFRPGNGGCPQLLNENAH